MIWRSIALCVLFLAGNFGAVASAAETRELVFSNNGVKLSGTLYYPISSGPVPAVVVLHDASMPTRDLPLYDHLKDLLPSRGMAVLVFDRRGSGKSDSAADNHSFDLLAEDGVAARAALAKDPRIDQSRIGYWGLSQGGWLALLAASKDPKAAFVIAVSAPLVPPDAQMNFAVGNILRANGYGPEDVTDAVATRDAMDQYLLGHLDRTTAQAALDRAEAYPWFKLIYLRAQLPDPATSTRKSEISFQPVNILDQLHQPSLLIFGSADPWIPVQDSLKTLKEEAHSNIDVQVIEGADHTMMTSLGEKDQMDPALMSKAKPEAPAYFAVLNQWLTRQGLIGPHKS